MKRIIRNLTRAQRMYCLIISSFSIEIILFNLILINNVYALRPLPFAQKGAEQLRGPSAPLVLNYNELVRQHLNWFAGRIKVLEGEHADDELAKMKQEQKRSQKFIHQINLLMGQDRTIDAFISAIHQIENGAKIDLSGAQTRALAIAARGLQSAPEYELELDAFSVLVIPKNSWLRELFVFRDNRYFILSDGDKEVPIIMINDGRRSVHILVMSILHEALHGHFSKGVNGILRKEEILYLMLNEALTQEATLKIMGNIYQDKEPYISDLRANSIYSSERDFVQRLRAAWGEKADQAIEQFLFTGDSAGLRELFGPAWDTLIALLNENSIMDIGSQNVIYEFSLSRINHFLQEEAIIMQAGRMTDIDQKQLHKNLQGTLLLLQESARRVQAILDVIEIDDVTSASI